MTISRHLADFICVSGITLLAIGLGRLALHKAGMKFAASGERVIFSAGAGFGILSYSVFVLGASQLLYPVAIYILLGGCAVLAIAGWAFQKDSAILSFLRKQESTAPLSDSRNYLLSKQESTAPLSDSRNYLLSFLRKQESTAPLSDSHFRWNDRLLGLLLLAGLLAGFLLVLTPAIGNDSLTYHLAVPQLFLKHHGFCFISGNIFSQYPLNSEMLFLLGLVLRGDVLAKGIHFVMALFTLLGMWQFVKRHLSNTAFLFLPPLLFYTIPSVFETAHMAYNDLTLAFYTFLAIYAFTNWSETRETAWLILCGVFCGIAMGTKYSALLMPFVGCLGILCVCRHHNEMDPRVVLRLICAYGLCAVVVGSPFYIKNWVLAGNPLYPFFHEIFGAKGWDANQARYYDLFLQNLGMGRNLWDYLLLPWNLSFHAKMSSPQFDGILGPVFILTLPFAAGIRKFPVSMKIMMVYCLFSFLFWMFSAQQIRYLIPLFPFLCIMTGHILDLYRKQKLIFMLLAICVGGSLIFNGYHIIQDFRKIRPLRVGIGLEERDAFLSRMIPSYGMFQYVNTHLPKETKVFFIYMRNQGYLCDRPYYSDSMFESYTIEKILAQSPTIKEVCFDLKKRGITHILYDINYVTGKFSTFSDEAKAKFLAFQEAHLELVKVEKGRYHLFKVKGAPFTRNPFILGRLKTPVFRASFSL